MARKKTPNVLDELLGNKATEPAEGNIRIPESRNAGILTNQRSGRRTKETYYLSAEIVDTLETARYNLRQMATTEKRKQISKSSIVEMALQLAFEDLEVQEQDSQIAQRIVERRR